MTPEEEEAYNLGKLRAIEELEEWRRRMVARNKSKNLRSESLYTKLRNMARRL